MGKKYFHTIFTNHMYLPEWERVWNAPGTWNGLAWKFNWFRKYRLRRRRYFEVYATMG